MLAYQKGTLISWNDDRGFGFIEPENKAQKVFIHISALKKGGRRPQEGDVIHYQLDMDRGDGDGIPCEDQLCGH
ncbi:cold-shock protein, DNA-binding [Candidatus Vecturithrix granuli]|uniref:Cold-shock protein, DNA-binding n=1 Tax=Vecturithrix granuli TaxID=1499967 RepID=A0A081BVV7_VECG1|nr:cold-shock protein, DNA-binding [Candidatus Vecturithrix granuli]